jgi:hypothetical protein
MTNNVPAQPSDPRSGPNAQQTRRGVYNPITIEDMENHQQPAWFENLETPQVRLLIALLFTIIFSIAWYRPEFSTLAIIVVVACLLYRLEPWQRKLAATPLFLAAIRFYLFLPAYSADLAAHIDPFTRRQDYTPGGQFGVSWILAFLSVCLFFMPRKESVTLKIVVVESLAVVLSGLLPAASFLSIFAMFNYTLFFAVAFGLFFDLKPNARALFSSTMVNASVPSPTHS